MSNDNQMDAAKQVIAEDAEALRLLAMAKESSEKDAEIEQLQAENERLRELLKGVIGDVVQAADWDVLMEKIEKEVGDD